MKIAGGSFGIKGSAYISRDNKLVIEGASKSIYGPDHVVNIDANVEKSKNFGILGFIVGSLVLGAILGLLFGIVGLIIAVIACIAGSFYSTKTNFVNIKFSDDKSIRLECTDRGVSKLMKFAN